jgi:protein TonB
MEGRKIARRKAWTIRRTPVLAVVSVFLSLNGRAAGDPACVKYAVHELSPGMSHDAVRLTMGGDGLKTLVRLPGSDETSGADYPGPSFDVYVQYDHRIDRRPSARAVLVRASMPMSLDAVQALVDRFGPPHEGADELVKGLHDGAAVWVDGACGVVLSAYRPRASWWTAEGGVVLQLETLDLARKGDSPASSILEAIDWRKNGTAAAPASSDILPEPAPEPGAVVLDLTFLVPSSVPAAPPAAVPAATSDESDVDSPMRVDPPAAAIVAPQQQAPLPDSPAPAPSTPPKVTPPPAPQTIASWRTTARAAGDPPAAPAANVPFSPQTIATWRTTAPPGSARSSEPRTLASPFVRTMGGAKPPSDRPAERVKSVPPVYPPTAKWLGVKGHVTLAIVVQADGSIGERPRVIAARPLGRGFEDAAVEATAGWRFRPAVRGGQPVASKLTIDVDFE